MGRLLIALGAALIAMATAGCVDPSQRRRDECDPYSGGDPTYDAKYSVVS